MYARVEWEKIMWIVSMYIEWTYTKKVQDNLIWKQLYIDSNWDIREYIPPKKVRLTESQKRAKKSFALWKKFFTVNRNKSVVAKPLSFTVEDVEKLYYGLIANQDRRYIPRDWGHE